MLLAEHGADDADVDEEAFGPFLGVVADHTAQGTLGCRNGLSTVAGGGLAYD